MAFGEKTNISSSKSMAQIESMLIAYGADSFMYGWEKSRAILSFKINNKHIKFILPMPDKDDDRFQKTERGKIRTETVALKQWEQACRQKWSALNLVIKAKFEAITAEISEFEDEFMTNIVLPNGVTVGEFMKPQIELSYKNGEMPPLIPMLNNEQD